MFFHLIHSCLHISPHPSLHLHLVRPPLLRCHTRRWVQALPLCFFLDFKTQATWPHQQECITNASAPVTCKKSNEKEAKTIRRHLSKHTLNRIQRIEPTQPQHATTKKREIRQAHPGSKKLALHNSSFLTSLTSSHSSMRDASRHCDYSEQREPIDSEPSQQASLISWQRKSMVMWQLKANSP